MPESPQVGNFRVTQGDSKGIPIFSQMERWEPITVAALAILVLLVRAFLRWPCIVGPAAYPYASENRKS